MKPIKNLVHITEYVNNQGEQKKRYQTVGKLFYNEQYSSFSVKLDAIPIGDSDGPWDGWLRAYDIDENRGQGNQQRGQQAAAPAQQPQYQQPRPAQPQYGPVHQPAPQYAPQPPARPADNLPTEQDMNSPIDISQIPF